MPGTLRILLTNDDGYSAKGIETLAAIMRQFGSLTVIAPKKPQSGMSMAVTLGGIPMAVRELPGRDGERWFYLDGTPASCVKYGIDEVFWPEKPDVVICGINHGSNAATAANYSGTLGAAEEGSLNGIFSIGVSLDDISRDADFSSVERLFPEIFRKLLESRPERQGVFYNVNFPSPSFPEVKGIRVGHMGMGHWEKEFEPFECASGASWEEGEKQVVMVGSFVDDTPEEDRLADHHIIKDGYISVTAHHVDYCDAPETERLRKLGFDLDF